MNRKSDDRREVGSQPLGTRKGVASPTMMQKATDSVIDHTCTVFHDGAVLLFGELSSWSLTARVATGRAGESERACERETERETDRERHRERERERDLYIPSLYHGKCTFQKKI